jgi:multiple sugar transport system permease protein
VRRPRNRLRDAGILVVVVLVAAWSLFPFLFALRNSFMHLGDTYRPVFIPFLQYQPTVQPWLDQFQQRDLLLGLRNSFTVSTVSLVLAMIIGTLGGYALARFRYRFPDNANVVMWFLSQRVMPPAVVIVPFLLLMAGACRPISVFGLEIPQPLQIYCAVAGGRNLLNTLMALVLVNTTFTLPFVILIARSVFAELPEALEEAALVDGATRLQVFWHLALPLAAPGLVAAAMIAYAFTWNEFIFALVLSGPQTQTMPLLMSAGEGIRGIDFTVVSVRALTAIVPPVVLALLAQRWIVRGLTFGAVKG